MRLCKSWEIGIGKTIPPVDKSGVVFLLPSIVLAC